MPQRRSILDLSNSELAFDLSSEPWTLPSGAASMKLGADVIRPGGIRTAPGRRPVGVSVAGEGPITSAFALEWEGRAAQFYRGRHAKGHWDGTQEYTVEATGDLAKYTDIGSAAGSFLLSVNSTGFFTHASYGDRVLIASPLSHRGVYTIINPSSNNDVNLDKSAGPSIASFSMIFAMERYPTYYYSDVGTAIGLSDREYLTKGSFLYDAEGPWSESMVGATIIFNSDRRTDGTLQANYVLIREVTTVFQENDTLVLAEAFAADLDEDDKFSIAYSEFFSKRGIWMSNGRKFWLLSDGTLEQHLDLGSDTYLGERWNFAQISSSSLLISNPRHRTRRIGLPDRPNALPRDDEALAGIQSPVKDTDNDISGATLYASWFMTKTTGGGSLNAGNIFVKIRAINLFDGLYSKLVDVRDSSGNTYITASSGDRINIHVRGYDSSGNKVWPPPTYERYTHIEVWRTAANGATYFLENRIELVPLNDMNGQAQERPTASNAATLLSATISGTYPITLSDTELVGLSILPGQDISTGGAPPTCKRVASLQGVTLAMGAASSSPERTRGYARDFYMVDTASGRSSFQRTGSLARLTKTDLFANYVFLDGDEFVITRSPDPSIPTGVFKISAAATSYVDIECDVGPTSSTNGVYGYVRRGMYFQTPAIESDEVVWYSRTDKYSPEEFPTRTLQLSRSGDVFRTMVNVSRYVAVVMASGVHLLYLDGTALRFSTPAAEGVGTPWEDSVIVIGTQVLWATEQGIRVMTVADEADDSGHLARVAELDPAGRFRDWFHEASMNGERIDAGVDTANQCVRWRRRIGANVFQCLQWSYRTGQFTLLDDDSGIFYARSRSAESETVSPLLYSITEEGAAFAVNHDGEHPYGVVAVQATIDESYELGASRIRKPAAFSSEMVGDVIRFTSSNESLDDVPRVVRVATNGELQFDPLPDSLSPGDRYAIGANRFRVRFAPIRHRTRSSTIKIDGIWVRALPGPRHMPQVDARLNACIYRNYATQALGSDGKADVPIYDESSVEMESKDRMAPILAEGAALELELRNYDARSHFRVELIEAEVFEDSDSLEDESEVS